MQNPLVFCIQSFVAAATSTRPGVQYVLHRVVLLHRHELQHERLLAPVWAQHATWWICEWVDSTTCEPICCVPQGLVFVVGFEPAHGEDMSVSTTSQFDIQPCQNPLSLSSMSRRP